MVAKWNDDLVEVLVEACSSFLSYASTGSALDKKQLKLILLQYYGFIKHIIIRLDIVIFLADKINNLFAGCAVTVWIMGVAHDVIGIRIIQ